MTSGTICRLIWSQLTVFQQVRCIVDDTEAPTLPCARCKRMNLGCAFAEPGRPALQGSRKTPKRTSSDVSSAQNDESRQPHPRRTTERSTADDDESPLSMARRVEHTDEISAQGETCAVMEDAVHDSTDAFNAVIRVYDVPRNSDHVGANSPNEAILHQSPVRPRYPSARPVQSQPGSSRSGLHEREPLHNENIANAWDDFWLVKHKWLLAEEAAWYIQTFVVPAASIFAGSR